MAVLPDKSPDLVGTTVEKVDVSGPTDAPKADMAVVAHLEANG